ncbi:hypothetical protein [Ruegeria jejuensis]|uniref:hypothetical protein n=1 Tax=Ruegeria jejuensis TaxID=3233338 RepID=UPI00355C4C32
MEELICQDADITLPELAAALEGATSVRAHPASIGKFLGKLGYSYKKGSGGHRAPFGARKKATLRLGTTAHAHDACPP